MNNPHPSSVRTAKLMRRGRVLSLVRLKAIGAAAGSPHRDKGWLRPWFRTEDPSPSAGCSPSAGVHLIISGRLWDLSDQILKGGPWSLAMLDQIDRSLLQAAEVGIGKVLAWWTKPHGNSSRLCQPLAILPFDISS